MIIQSSVARYYQQHYEDSHQKTSNMEKEQIIARTNSYPLKMFLKDLSVFCGHKTKEFPQKTARRKRVYKDSQSFPPPTYVCLLVVKFFDVRHITFRLYISFPIKMSRYQGLGTVKLH